MFVILISFLLILETEFEESNHDDQPLGRTGMQPTKTALSYIINPCRHPLK